MTFKKIFFVFSVVAATLSARSQEPSGSRQLFANIGDLPLVSGDTIYQCQVGYRVFGRKNAGQSNIILFPTWFSGTTAALQESVPGRLIDSSKYCIILVDALGDGLSSSPSNSLRQPRLHFPVFTIRDMVESQHRLLTEVLHISKVYAIAGISMGGMQSFQWAVSYPDFAKKIIPIVGSPQLATNDLLLWTAEMQSLEADTAYHMGEYQGLPTIVSVAALHRLALSSPSRVSTTVSREEFSKMYLEATTPGFDWNNWHRQLQAMISHDIASGDQGSLEKAARRIHAKMLIVTSRQDHMVNPIPATKMAKILGAQILELKSDCGHLAPGCETPAVVAAIRGFLDGPSGVRKK